MGFKFNAHFPLRNEISAISFVCYNEEDALAQWNSARDHDGLTQASRLPPDTEISVLEYDDFFRGVYIEYSDINFSTLLHLPETTEEQLTKCEEHLLKEHDEGHSCVVLDMSSFSKTAKIKDFHQLELERVHKHREALMWLCDYSNQD